MPDLIPLLELLIAAVLGLYLAGLQRLWGRAGWGHGIPAWRAACFAAGAVVLALSLAGPMDELADRSFAAHMVQHMLLMKVIPPLLLLGEFNTVFLHAVGTPAAHRLREAWNHADITGRAWRALTRPWVVWALFGLALWLWHAPNFFQAALRDEWIHALEHMSFLGSGLLFWWYLVQRRERVVRYGAAVLMLVTTLLHESALGALLTFSAASWYPFYGAADPWGLSPLVDQQLAGLIMWIGGGLLFGGLIVYYFGAWLSAIEKRAQAMRPGYSDRRRV